MLNFDNFLSDLSSLELSGTVFGNSGLGNVPEDQMPKVVSAVNAGLRQLYSRFLLKEAYFILAPKPVKVMYPIHSKYALSSVTSTVPEEDRYIEDSIMAPYKDDLLKITEVWSTDGRKFPLNDLGQPGGMFTPSPNVLQLPQPMEEFKLSVSYQASHPRVTLDTVELELPMSMEDVLRAYVGYKILSPIGTQEATAKSQELFQTYEMLLKVLTEADTLGSSHHTTLHKFNLRGFV